MSCEPVNPSTVAQNPNGKASRLNGSRTTAAELGLQAQVPSGAQHIARGEPVAVGQAGPVGQRSRIGADLVKVGDLA